MKQPNRVKANMLAGRVSYGFNLIFPSTDVVEILGMLDFDYVWLDGEHGPFSLKDIEEICRTAESVGLTTLARVPDVNASTILRFLDRGVQQRSLDAIAQLVDVAPPTSGPAPAAESERLIWELITSSNHISLSAFHQKRSGTWLASPSLS